MNQKFPRPNLRFFWQLFTAFSLMIMLMCGGMFIASQFILGNLAGAADSTQLVLLWRDRLAERYTQQNSWQGVDTFLSSYPCGSGWRPGDEDWQVNYMLATPDGAIVAASDPARVGQQLSFVERFLGTPILQSQQVVGTLLILTREQIGMRLAPGRLFVVGLVIASFSLLVGVLLSRQISRPFSEMTHAMRAVAAGDLGVRVANRYSGEAGEMTETFNQMADELAHTRELRRNLTADVAHELRTPLTVIRARLEGVLDGVYPATPEYLNPALDTIQLLTHLVEDLRLLALADAGHLTLDRQPTEVGDLLQDALVNFTPQAEDRGIKLVLELAAPLPQAMVDRRRIAQVLGNLIANALRHTPGGGQVTLSARSASSGQVEVIVADTGEGILPEDMPYVFERFWRGDKSRARVSGGSGLGLAIAKQLVELHGGRIYVESAPGGGSTFRFTLLSG